MKNKKKKILIIDDHSLIIEGYKSILSFNEHGLELNFKQALSCQAAYDILKTEEGNFDVIFLDMTLPPYTEMGIYSGSDLFPYIKKYQPESKIILVTSHTEQFLLYIIYKKLNPDGILIKSDFTPVEFLAAFENILEENKHYSHTMREAIKKIAANYSFLDSLDMQIITLLSERIQSKSLTEHLSIGKSAIDKRKNKIKSFFKIEKGNDEDIIREAKKQNFI